MERRIVGFRWWWWDRSSRRTPPQLLLLLPVLLLLGSLADGQTSSNDSLVNRRVSPPELIRLENGATTLISTLEDFLELAGERQHRDEQRAEVKSAALVAALVDHISVAPTPAPELESKHSESNKEEHGHHQEPNSSNNNNKSKPIPQHYQVKSLLNVTHDYPLAYSQVICGYVWPIVAAITLFTNLMIVFVLTQSDMRTPTNVVLTAIAIADIIPILVPVPWFVYLFAMGNEKQVLYPPIACYFYQHSTRSVSEIFYFLSTWLNVLLACQDYLTACWPKAAKRYCQIRVVVVEIVALTLLAFILNLPQALKLVFKPVKFYYNGQLTWGCKALQAKWFKDLVGEYVSLYDDIFTAIIVLFVDGGPALVLITLTALLIRQLQRQKIQGHLLMEKARTASKRRRERHRQQEVEASARVMIFVLLAFLAVKIPFATTYTLMIIQSRFEIHFVDNLVDFQKAITLTDLVFVLSYPINFTIFCCCSKKFRHKCVQLLGECSQSSRDTRAKLMRTISATSWASTNADEQPHLNQNRNRKRHSAPLRRSDVELEEEEAGAEAPRARLIGDQHRPPLARSHSWHQRPPYDFEVPPPPPPPPLYYQHQHQLPHIVTTRYESIREQQEPGEFARADSPDASSLGSSVGQQTGQQSEDLGELAGGRPSVGRGCSDPGFLGIKHLACMVRRSSGPSAGTKSATNQGDRLATDDQQQQHRSLSLSHSRLSTLPSSTGALADIMLTTFLGAANSAGSGSRSTGSEPARGPRRRQ